VASDESNQERTEQPSARRREQARDQGRVAFSPDLTAAAALLAGLGAVVLTAGPAVTSAVEMFARGLVVSGREDLTIDAALGLALHALAGAGRLAWPFLLGPLLVGAAVHLAQTRATVTTEGLKPRWERLAPGTNLRRLLGPRGAVGLLKALLKLAVVGWVAVATLSADWSMLMGAGLDGGEARLAAVGAVIARIWLRVGIGYLLLAAFDYGFLWWRHEQSLRMTKEEARQETRETEANPALRQRVRTLHGKMVSRRMMAAVKTADVVVRNPTHVAVALAYKAGRMRAPRVVAKGERLLALRIIEVAQEARVPVVENRPLARALFTAVDIGRDVPPTLYRAVAEVLAYVYSLRGGRIQ
jgi:flagellar biosynthetic protein FlhB